MRSTKTKGSEDRGYRHELKFFCTETGLYFMEDRIRRICRLDTHTGQAKSYVVRSLYFDTYDNACYQENKAGIDDRKKYRIRIYDADTKMIKLECKRSFRGMKAKEVCEITAQQCLSLIKGDEMGKAGIGQDLLQRFLVEKRLELLEPKIIVEYTRTPYIYPAGNVRITFDRGIRSSSSFSHFMEKRIVGRSILPVGMNLLEVKYDEMIPTAVMELLTAGMQFAMNRTSFSKYALSREYSINMV